jgi:hypothetical protein
MSEFESEQNDTAELPKSSKDGTDNYRHLPSRQNTPLAENPMYTHKSTRRRFITGAIGALAAVGVGGIFGLTKDDAKEKPLFDTKEIIETPLSRLNTIADIDLFSGPRNHKEMEYAQNAQSIEEVDLGLMVCGKREVREVLLAKRAECRAQNPEMTQLNDIQRLFCDQHGISEEVLAMCLDGYDHAMKVIDSLKLSLREDRKGQESHPEMLMINPGGMAKLIMSETTGFTNIGGAKAVDELVKFDESKGVDVPDEERKGKLQIIVDHVNRQTGLRLRADNVPGSERGDTAVNSSGGAIGIQFMPERAVEYYQKISGKFGSDTEGNIFDPMQSITMAWTFLACQEQVPGGIRYGYMRGNEESIWYSLMKWNQSEQQMTPVLNAAHAYFDLTQEV